MRLPIHFGCGSIPTRSPHFGAWDYQTASLHNKVKENFKSSSDGEIITAIKPWPRSGGGSTDAAVSIPTP